MLRKHKDTVRVPMRVRLVEYTEKPCGTTVIANGKSALPTIRDKYRLQAQADVFNVANSHTVLVETQAMGVSKYTGVAGQATSAYSIAPYTLGGPGGRPTSVLQARLLRLAVQFHF